MTFEKKTAAALVLLALGAGACSSVSDREPRPDGSVAVRSDASGVQTTLPDGGSPPVVRFDAAVGSDGSHSPGPDALASGSDAASPPSPTGPGGPASVEDLEPGDPSQDKFYMEPVNGFAFDIWIPGGIKNLRCVIAGGQQRRELARLNHCAQMRIPSQPTPKGTDIVAALEHYATLTGHPELRYLQVLGSGYSFTFGERSTQLGQVPDRFLAIFGGGIHSAYPKTVEAGRVPWFGIDGDTDNASIPGAYIQGGSNAAWWLHNLEIARKLGALYGKGLMWGKFHQEGDSRLVLWIFFHQAIAHRAPPANQTLSKLAVKNLDQTTGWLVSAEEWATLYPTIAPYASYKGDRNKALWAFDAFTAHVFRAYIAKGSPVTITDPPCTCDKCQPVHVAKGTPVSVTFTVSGPAPAKLQLFDGDKPLRELAAPPYKFSDLQLSPGVHAMIVEATYADGKKALSKPRAIVVTKGPIKQEVPLCD